MALYAPSGRWVKSRVLVHDLSVVGHCRFRSLDSAFQSLVADCPCKGSRQECGYHRDFAANCYRDELAFGRRSSAVAHSQWLPSRWAKVWAVGRLYACFIAELGDDGDCLRSSFVHP